MVCRRAAIGIGARAIDIGCGPLGAMAALSEIVGDTGEVFGLDSSAEALARAKMLLEHLSLRNVQLVHADLRTVDLDELELRGRFDFAYCRLVLLHQQDPTALLQRVLELVRPGGYIAYQDILDDPTRPACEPAVPAQTRGWKMILELFARRSLTPDVARDHGTLARTIGCEVVHQRGKFPVLSAREGLEIVQQLLNASRNHLSEAGVASPLETDALIAELESAKAGSYRYWHGPLAIETLIRRPA
jgi:SAM-dependent methyltransferase